MLLWREGQADRAQQPPCATHGHFEVPEALVGFGLRSQPPYEGWNLVLDRKIDLAFFVDLRHIFGLGNK